MPAKDIYHETCIRALEKDGWTITHDPMTIPVDGTNLLIDVGAERIVTAERDGERIAEKITQWIISNPVDQSPFRSCHSERSEESQMRSIPPDLI